VRIRFLNLLLAALVVLAAVRLWTAARAPLPQLPPAPAAESAAPPGSMQGAGEPSAASPAAGGTEGYEVIVARDLFSAARGVVPPAPPTAAKPAPKPPVKPKLTLYGVVIVDGEKAAYLQEGTQEARPRRIREGESFAGGTVKEIRPDGITFLFAGGETAVPLRTPKDAGPAPALQVPPQPQQAVPPRRPAQPAAPGGQVRRPPQATPGVQRMFPAPGQEPALEEEIPLDEEEEFIDEEDFIDDSEMSPEDFEE
jgi:hypothetical protein